MKTGPLCKKAQTKKVSFLCFIILILCLLASCASKHDDNHTTLSAEEIDNYRNNQKRWLASLREDISPDAALRQVLSYQQYFFQYKENEKLFQYMQGQYPVTGTLFGLFFEDGRLKSLLLDQDVTDFGSCRANLLKQQDPWPISGFQSSASWIRLQSRLGEEYDEVSIVNTQRTNDSEGVSADEAVEIITHLPLAVIALPFYGLYKLAGGTTESPEQLKGRADQVVLSVTTDSELIQLLGEPYSKKGPEQREIWSYTSPEILFGVVERTVVWSESLFWGVPLNSLTVRSNNMCLPSN